MGGSVTDQAAVTAFLRSGLTPLLRQHDCGAIIIHHTNKPAVGKEKGGWQAGDFAYAGGGSSEWGNWARAVIVIRSIGCHDVFELVLAKRGGRLGWEEADGVTKSYKKMIGHSKVESQIFWHELTEAECEERGLVKDKIDTSQEDVMALVPVTDDIAKSLLTARAQAKGIGENRAKRIIKGLIEEGHLVEVSHRRQGSRPAVHVARVLLVVQEVTE